MHYHSLLDLVSHCTAWIYFVEKRVDSGGIVFLTHVENLPMAKTR